MSATHGHERASQGMWACGARPWKGPRGRRSAATLRGVSLDFVKRIPTPAEHRLLAESVGWHDAFAWEAMPASLAASLAGVVVLDAGQPIAMGRVVGDGAFYFYVQDVVVAPEHQGQDVVVAPEHQGQGVGGRIVESLVEQVERIGPPKSFIGLFAAGRAAALYERLGFAAHPGMTGMFRVVQEPAVAQG